MIEVQNKKLLFIRRGGDSLLIFQSKITLLELAPCFKPVAGHRRASPSATLDKNVYMNVIVNEIIN